MSQVFRRRAQGHTAGAWQTEVLDPGIPTLSPRLPGRPRSADETLHGETAGGRRCLSLVGTVTGRGAGAAVSSQGPGAARHSASLPGPDSEQVAVHSCRTRTLRPGPSPDTSEESSLLEVIF